VNLLDSSCWIEYFAGTDLGTQYREVAAGTGVLVPTIVLCEVVRRVTSSQGEEQGEIVAVSLSGHTMVDLTEEVALLAAELSLQHHLALADSIILATARLYDATLWTQDAHFANIEGVRYFPKKST
jgi:predicted nucleic acid-binding protein